MINWVTSTDLSVDDAKKYGIGAIKLVKGFITELNEKNSTIDRDLAIGELNEIIIRIEGNLRLLLL